MKGKRVIREEHRKASDALKALTKKGTKAGANGPLPEDMNQYFQLHTIKETLEWVHPGLIKTTAKPGAPNYFKELMDTGHHFLEHGPVNATLTWPRATFVD